LAKCPLKTQVLMAWLPPGALLETCYNLYELESSLVGSPLIIEGVPFKEILRPQFLLLILAFRRRPGDEWASAVMCSPYDMLPHTGPKSTEQTNHELKPLKLGVQINLFSV
jgi:hypothetical protein